MLGDSTTSVLGGGAGEDSAVPETTNQQDGLMDDVGESGAVTAEDNNKTCGEDERGRSGEGDNGDRSFGGNRWPRQETLALLKIRSEMDVAFRDASVKGPLWEQVSRKLGELGYHRSAKKCKEKFENVYKYHKRTKEVRCGKPDSKSYKFFEQLEALENHPPLNFHSHLSKPPPPATAASPPTTVISHIPSTVPSTTTAVPHLMNISFTQPNPTIHLQSMPPPPPLPFNNPTSLATTIAPLFQTNVSSGAAGLGFEADLISNSSSDDVDSSTSSDEASRQRKKRKWKDFFERLMREVIERQEEMQKRFLEAIEKREQERVVREEAWRMQEMAKINREKEILAQERSMAAAKDAAITSFLQKLTQSHHNNDNPSPPPPPPPPPRQQPISISNPTPVVQPPPQQASTLQVVHPNSTPQKLVNNNEYLQMEIVKRSDNGGESYRMSPASSSSRWPKVEVEALIKLRTNLDAKYQENGPKGPLWEEISSAMKRLGYNRNAKRCKEKWENINKYFKKVKESKKTRPEDSKTCPYFHQLDALYKEKNINNNNGNKFDNVIIGSSTQIMPHQQQPLMVRPEQQWPPQQELVRSNSANKDMESEPMDRDEKDEDDDEDDDEEEDEEGGENYEIVASKPASMSVAE
ncbi:trihelix transcription factor GT-2-like [Cucurbita moschata]|uniref:Trihelix transcription factor GT-2-like n=1 Tax=Cucurbita moschata TaxID=3662 RepID=A0A6J1EHH3_CUCMO|nr:trihelix transcription factor GT-2-like [Cucurbita moschata]